MSLQRCFSTLGCPELSLDAVLALAAKHEVGSVEVRSLGGTTELANYFAAHFGSPQALAEHLRGSAVRIVAFDASLRLVNGTSTERDQLVAMVPWAEALGLKWLRVFDGGKTADAADIAAAYETLSWWRELRRKNRWRVDLMVETHDSLITAERILCWRNAGLDVAILWDAHHTWRKGGEDPAATWDAIASSVVHVHVKDSIDVPSARHPFTYVLPGDGGFPVARTLAALSASGFSGPVSLEWEKLWHPYLPSLEEALSVARVRAWW